MIMVFALLYLLTGMLIYKLAADSGSFDGESNDSRFAIALVILVFWFPLVILVLIQQ